MIIWLSLLIPCLAAILMVCVYHHKFVWWELFLPTLVTLVIITIFKLSVETLIVSDTEYNASLIKKVVYYQPWETWVKRTCSRTHKVGKTSYTTYYDCSYCDYNPEEYKAYDVNNNQYSITYDHYSRLRTEWNNSQFIELNRNIRHHWSCGKDGDAYESTWDKTPEHAESNIYEKSYENKTKLNHSAFHYPDISDEEAYKMGLYTYPKYYETYRQPILIGNFNNHVADYKTKVRQFEYLGGKLGMHKGVKFYILLFENKPLSIALQQEAYWEGGNDNEVVICLSINPQDKKLQWVKPFSWTPEKRTLVELREELMNIDTLNLDKFYPVVENTINNYYVKKDFRDFNYLTVDPPLFEIIITYILALLITIGVNYWCYSNEHEN